MGVCVYVFMEESGRHEKGEVVYSMFSWSLRVDIPRSESFSEM